jgi:hypothetical protein
MRRYEGSVPGPWHADEDDSMVRFHRGHMQAFKAPKQMTPYAEYWPGPKTIEWMLDALNERERSNPMLHTVND